MENELTKREQSILDFMLESLDSDYKEDLKKLKEAWGEELETRWNNEESYQEVGDRTYVASESFEQFIKEHPAVILNPEAYRMASLISELMRELYQLVMTNDIFYEDKELDNEGN